MPELFDVVELFVTWSESNLHLGVRGATVACYDDGNYEIEFSERSGETIALCTLSTEQFLVVWKSKERRWLSVSELLAAMVGRLSDERQQQVLEWARSMSQKESVFGGVLRGITQTLHLDFKAADRLLSACMSQ
ncbi:DUF4926 domain-containing protein [Microcoleus sp. B3-D7]|uniref:DUF4926 domain-containing protein n=1 Tax=Microcoleus sp. B3-D7 TaxID=2818659 RepID=UPI002FD16BBA